MSEKDKEAKERPLGFALQTQSREEVIAEWNQARFVRRSPEDQAKFLEEYKRRKEELYARQDRKKGIASDSAVSGS